MIDIPFFSSWQLNRQKGDLSLITSPDTGREPSPWLVKTYERRGSALFFILFGVVFLWLIAFHIDGAVVSPGEIRVKSQVKNVAHPSGGVVGKVFVVEGQSVSRGETLLELDPVESQSGVMMLGQQRLELEALSARLMAQRDRAKDVNFPSHLLLMSKSQPAVATVLRDQELQFRAAVLSLTERLTQFKEREHQVALEMESNTARQEGAAVQLEAARSDLAGFRTMQAEGFVSPAKTRESIRDEAKLHADLLALKADRLKLQNQVAELRSNAVQAQADFREAALGKLQEAASKLAEIREHQVVADHALRRIQVTAPQDGRVQSMTVFAPGAVVAPGGTILSIVPAKDSLVVEARIPAVERDRIHEGQTARVRLSAFEGRTTPELSASVSRIAADRTHDPQNGSNWYLIELTLAADYQDLLGNAKQVTAGMPAEVFLSTQSRSVMSYLIKPLVDQFHRALRER